MLKLADDRLEFSHRLVVKQARQVLDCKRRIGTKYVKRVHKLVQLARVIFLNEVPGRQID